MPTPFMHLQLTQKLRDFLSSDHWLHDVWPAFCLGNIAPDYQSICETRRDETHFYPIPPAKDDYGAFGRLLTAFPELNPADLPPGEEDQKAFVLGYGVHLHFDLLWDHRVLTPHFRHADWLDPYQRFTAHNILLTYLDRDARGELDRAIAPALAQANGLNRLPFDPQQHLHRWQQLIVEQLHPTAPSQTITIYAERMRMSADTFRGFLEDPHWMNDHVFQRVDMGWVDQTLQQAVVDGAAIVGDG